jgi:hypothetical protein
VPISPVGTIVEMHRFDPPIRTHGGKEINDATVDQAADAITKPILSNMKFCRPDNVRDALMPLNV